MTIEIVDSRFDLKDFLFREVELPQDLPSCVHASKLLTRWISGGKEFEIYTSGSTGTPRRLILKRKWLETSALQTIELLKLWNEKILCCLPTDKIGGLMMVVRSLAGGFDLSIKEPTSDPMKDITEDHDYSFISLVPYQLNKILADPISKLKLNRFKNILVGGAEISNDLMNKIGDMDPNFYHTYGMTETCSHIALKKLNRNPWPHFKPNPYIELKTNDEGLLSVRGYQTGNEWINTTDIIKKYEDGTFDFIGRNDHAINTGGFKVFPEILEQKILNIFISHNLDLNIAVTSKKHNDLGEQVVLVIEQEMPHFELMELLISGLKNYEIPKQIVKIKNIPVLENGKLDRLKLKDWILEKG